MLFKPFRRRYAPRQQPIGPVVPMPNAADNILYAPAAGAIGRNGTTLYANGQVAPIVAGPHGIAWDFGDGTYAGDRRVAVQMARTTGGEASIEALVRWPAFTSGTPRTAACFSSTLTGTNGSVDHALGITEGGDVAYSIWNGGGFSYAYGVTNGTTPIPTGSLVHLVGVSRYGQIEVWLNGVLAGVDTGNGGNPGENHDPDYLVIGGGYSPYAGGGDWIWPDLVYMAAAYNRALPPEEIAYRSADPYGASVQAMAPTAFLPNLLATAAPARQVMVIS